MAKTLKNLSAAKAEKSGKKNNNKQCKLMRTHARCKFIEDRQVRTIKDEIDGDHDKDQVSIILQNLWRFGAEAL